MKKAARICPQNPIWTHQAPNPSQNNVFRKNEQTPTPKHMGCLLDKNRQREPWPQTRHLLCPQPRNLLCQQTRHLLCQQTSPKTSPRRSPDRGGRFAAAPVWRMWGGCLGRCLLTQQMSCLLTQQMSWLQTQQMSCLQTHLCNLQQWPHGQVEVFARILIFGARG